MLLTVAFVFWIASSYIEYKIVCGWPKLMPYFTGIKGIVISLLIGAFLAFAVGASNAMPIVLAQMVGLATNEFMFKLFDTVKHGNDRRREVQNKVTSFKNEHPTLFSEAVEGVKAGIKIITVVILAFVWICGLPVRIIRWVQSGLNYIKSLKGSDDSDNDHPNHGSGEDQPVNSRLPDPQVHELAA